MASYELAIIFLLIWTLIIKINALITKQRQPLAPLLSSTIRIRSSNLSETKKIDCFQQRIICNTNLDCLSTCNLIDQDYACELGRCVPSRNIIKNVNEAKKCNEQHGLFSAIENIDGLNVATFTCISRYPALWDDNDQKQPGVCEHGKLNTNVVKHSPKLNDCVCDPNYVLAFNAARPVSAYSTQIPVCIEKKKTHLYPNYTTA